MIKKFFNDIVEFIKEEYKFIIFLLLSVILFLFPVNYYIIVGGDISDIDDRVIISDSYNSKGSFNISYVSELKGRLGPYLLSYIIPGWESESANDYKYVDEETIQDIEFRNRLDLVSTNGNAIKWAYELASKEYKIVDTKVYVISVSDDMPSDLKIGDRIVKFDDKEIENVNSIREYLGSVSKDEVTITVIRNNKEVNITAKVYSENGKKLIGVYLQEVSEYETDPDVEIKFKSRESGPSAGLITTLSIYDKLTEEDLTKGLKIAGTGTIEADGSIGKIGGVKYKLAGAVKNKADVFLVPSGDNYEECVKLKRDNKYKIKIIGVSTIEEAIEKLENLEV